jgi:hypothetical protein
MKYLTAILLLAMVALSSLDAAAQLPAGDLRLWLKADSLNLADDAPVTQWIDESTYGTIFSPRTTTEPNGPFGGAPVEERPHLETSIVNGKAFKSVRFERDGTALGNPSVDRSGSTDRLYQVNNRTPGADPLAIADGLGVTTFTVMRPDVTTAGTLGYQVAWALRGNDASLLQLGISPQGNFNYVTYDANTEYRAQNPATANKWQIVVQKITEAGNGDPIQFLVNDTENVANSLVVNPVTTNGGVVADRNDFINNDPVGVQEPFGIGGHAQDCCGEGETFGGDIAEIIIYARTLSTAETNQVYNYLTSKYFAAPPFLGGDYNGDGIVDAADYVVWRDNLGQFYALTNGNPEAVTEGFVDDEDYDYWVANYGHIAGSLAANAIIPEASTGLLLLQAAAVVALVQVRHRRSQRVLGRLAASDELHESPGPLGDRVEFSFAH